MFLFFLTTITTTTTGNGGFLLYFFIFFWSNPLTHPFNKTITRMEKKYCFQYLHRTHIHTRIFISTSWWHYMEYRYTSSQSETKISAKLNWRLVVQNGVAVLVLDGWKFCCLYFPIYSQAPPHIYTLKTQKRNWAVVIQCEYCDAATNSVSADTDDDDDNMA